MVLGDVIGSFIQYTVPARRLGENRKLFVFGAPPAVKLTAQMKRGGCRHFLNAKQFPIRENTIKA